MIICPDCDGKNIASCPGGTCLRPGEWAKSNIKYICMDCLCEFGDADSAALGGVEIDLLPGMVKRR